MGRIVVAVTLAVVVLAAAAVTPMVLIASDHERGFTVQQLQKALAGHGIASNLFADRTIIKRIAGPKVVALLDDNRDLVGNGSLESGLSGTVLDSSRAASVYDLGRTSGWLRLQKRNIVVEVTTSKPGLATKAIAAVRSLK